MTENEKQEKTHKVQAIKTIFQSNKTKKYVISTLLILLLAIIVSLIVVAFKVKASVDNMQLPLSTTNSAPIHEDAFILEPTIVEEEVDEDFYILILGLDYRDNHNAMLTDSIMVLHIIPEETVIKLLSIPRDLLVENNKGHLVKINSVFSEGLLIMNKKAQEEPAVLINETIKLGSEDIDKAIISGAIANTRNKIDELLHINIKHTVLVNFNTITSLVDAVGGIEIDVKRSMHYKATKLNLEPGLQVLNGEDALGYARFREDDRGTRYYASDFERGLQQQEVVKALAHKVVSWESISKVLKLLDIVSKNVHTDMDYFTMYALLTKYYNVFNSQSFLSVPFPEHYSNNGDVIIPTESLLILQESFKK